MSHVTTTSHDQSSNLQGGFRELVDSLDRDGLMAEFNRFRFMPRGSLLTLQQLKDLECLTERLYEVLPDGELLVNIETTMFAIKDALLILEGKALTLDQDLE